MTIRVSGKSISIGEALRGRVSDRTEEVLRKYFDGNYSGHVTFSKDEHIRADASAEATPPRIVERASTAFVRQPAGSPTR